MKKSTIFESLDVSTGIRAYCQFSKKNSSKFNFEKSIDELEDLGKNKSNLFLFSVMIILFLTGFNSWSQCPTGTDGIAIDGNPCDWEILNGTTPPIFTHLQDAFGTGVDDQFTEGSKDFYLAANLAWADGRTKAKNDIANVAAFLKNEVLYFAADKTSNNGDAQIGFWFYLNNTAPRVLSTKPNRKGDFYPEHVNGDLLVLANFISGGRNAVVTVFRWVGTGGTHGNGSLLEITGTGAAGAQNNTNSTYPVPDGWNFTADMYDVNEFFEGSIDLTKTGLTNFCFTSFLAEGRSSQELTASLDDFAGGAFDTAVGVTVNSPTICAGGTATITATLDDGANVTDYDFSWEVPTGAADPGNVASFPATVAGDYSVTITQKGLGCTSGPSTGRLIINPNPTADAGDAPAAQCPGENGNDFTLNGSFSNGNAQWTVEAGTATGSAIGTVASGGTTDSPTVHVEGIGSVTFVLTVTSDKMPPCDPYTDKVTVTVNARADGPSLKITDVSLCGPSTGSIEVCNPTVGYTYTLYIDGASPVVDEFKAGEDSVIFDGLVAGSNPSVTATSPLSLGGCESGRTDCNEAGAGCANRIVETAKVVAPIEAKTESAGFDAYPVPFKDQLTIKYNFDYESDVKIEVFNSQGIRVFSKTDTNGYLNKETALDLKMNKGKEQMYVVKITTNRGSTTKKVMSSR